MVNSGFDTSNCIVTIKESKIEQVNLDTIMMGYKIWKENQYRLVGYKAYQLNFINSSVLSLTEDITYGYNMIGLELAFVPK